MGRAKELYMEQQEEKKYEWIKEQFIENGLIKDDEEPDIYSNDYQEYENEYNAHIENINLKHEEELINKESQFSIENIDFIIPKYALEDFKGMRDTGFVASTDTYTVAHYERKEYRLVEIAEKIKSSTTVHFVLFDYKGLILTDDKKIEKALVKMSNGGMIETSDGDSLTIHYDENLFTDIYFNKLSHKRLQQRILFYLKRRNYTELNIEKNKTINEYDFDFLITNNKNDYLAVLEIKQLFDEDIKTVLLTYKSAFEKEQAIIPRIFLITGDDKNFEFHELINNELVKLNNLPTYAKLNSKVDAKEYKTNLHSIATYGSDIPEKKEDCLDISSDVDAFAKLIAYKNSAMPLSIGLFGKWGSGKSFFMKELESKIKEYSTSENEHFSKDVIHVRFNAWHYSDTNLWASLTYRIFEEIDNKFNNSKDKTHVLYENLESSQKEIKEKDIEKTKLQNKISTINQKINEYKEKRDEEKEELKKSNLFDFSKAILNEPTIQQSLSEVKNTIGLKNETIEDIKYINYELKSWLGMFKKVLNDKKLTNLFLVLIIIFTCIGITFFLFEDEISQLIASGIAFLGSIILYSKKIKPNLEKLKKHRIIIQSIIDNWDKSQDKIRELNYQQIKDKEMMIIEFEKDILENEREVTYLINKKSNIENEIKDIKSGKYFKDFINSKVSSSDYKKHLGLISLIRKDLTELEDFLSNKNNHKRDFSIDRIVLYIDDLDRCNDKLVVEVLEAIHLLLAFELFVVVVGIDLRWIENSLNSKYSVLSDETINLSSKDYIEKIFQIPFKVNSLNNDNKVNLVNTLFDKTQLSYFEDENTKKLKKDKEEETKKLLEKVIVGKSKVTSITTTTITENKYSELKLTKDEVEYINKLIVFINDLPRTINRFVNTYKVLRSHELVQKSLEESFINYKTIVLLIIEVFWKENNNEPINFKDEFKDDYENPFDNKSEVIKLIHRFKFED